MRNRTRALLIILVAVSFVCQPLVSATPSRMTGDALTRPAPRDLPDLRVRGVKMGDPTTGQFSVLIQNIGKAKAPNYQLRLWVKGEGGKTHALVEVNQPPIEGNGGFTWVKISAEKGLLAYQRYEIITDSSNKVAESNESNNSWRGSTGKV